MMQPRQVAARTQRVSQGLTLPLTDRTECLCSTPGEFDPNDNNGRTPRAVASDAVRRKGLCDLASLAYNSLPNATPSFLQAVQFENTCLLRLPGRPRVLHQGCGPATPRGLNSTFRENLLKFVLSPKVAEKQGRKSGTDRLA